MFQWSGAEKENETDDIAESIPQQVLLLVIGNRHAVKQPFIQVYIHKALYQETTAYKQRIDQSMFPPVEDEYKDVNKYGDA